MSKHVSRGSAGVYQVHFGPPSFGDDKFGGVARWNGEGGVSLQVAAYLCRCGVAEEGAEGAEGDRFASVDGILDFKDSLVDDCFDHIGADACGVCDAAGKVLFCHCFLGFLELLELSELSELSE